MEPHYSFPPASGYRLNKCLFLLKSDHAFLKRYLEDPAEVVNDCETPSRCI